MGDHFVLCVDRLITASTLESATAETQRPSQFVHASLRQNSVLSLNSSPEVCNVDSSIDDQSCEKGLDPETFLSGDGEGILVECRICQEEDDDRNMESPCACSGSLKYAHRKCVQRWCNEKGDITCEICHQQYKPGYTAPQPLVPDDLPIDIRSSWQISEAQLDLRDPHLLAMVAAERHFFETEYGEYASANSSSAASCCRSVALILMALLLLRHALAITSSGGEEDLSTFITLFLLRAAGFILPCYIMARAMSVLHRRRQRQEAALAAAEVALRLQEGQTRVANSQSLISVQ